MNGPEHYREAESLIERGMASNTMEFFIAAQAHATLALAAATAGGRDSDQNVYDGPDIRISEYDKPHWSAILEPTAVVGSTPEGQTP